MAISVVHMTVWKTFFTLYCIMLRRLQWLTHGALSYEVGHQCYIKAGIL